MSVARFSDPWLFFFWPEGSVWELWALFWELPGSVFKMFLEIGAKNKIDGKCIKTEIKLSFLKVLRCVPQRFRQIVVSVSQLWAVGRLVADFGLLLSGITSPKDAT